MPLDGVQAALCLTGVTQIAILAVPATAYVPVAVSGHRYSALTSSESSRVQIQPQWP